MEQNVRAAGVHLVRLSRVDGLFLNSLYLKRILLHVKYLAEVHYDSLVDFLPQMGSEDLNERDFKSWNFAVHKDASEV